MKYWQCKCGSHKSFGSMPPAICSGCDKCGTDLAFHPDYHGKPAPHEFKAYMVETDNGSQPLSRCRYCLKTKKQIEKS